jgi:2-polyprenyl-6-methoxyphenol hydroxylase-like FAD-dependent oxidoreductase
MGLWTAFAHAIRESVLGTAALAAQRAAAAGSMNAVDNLDDYARIARAYADATERLAGSFSRLYATLSPAQRCIADAMFRPSPTLAARPVGGTRR